MNDHVDHLGIGNGSHRFATLLVASPHEILLHGPACVRGAQGHPRQAYVDVRFDEDDGDTQRLHRRVAARPGVLPLVCQLAHARDASERVLGIPHCAVDNEVDPLAGAPGHSYIVDVPRLVLRALHTGNRLGHVLIARPRGQVLAIAVDVQVRELSGRQHIPKGFQLPKDMALPGAGAPSEPDAERVLHVAGLLSEAFDDLGVPRLRQKCIRHPPRAFSEHVHAF
mmetsp:Transcript_102947/g.314952  ORF Transcript_102947/g.314952 Transcript_102947/m.314952 type:complete len:225 (-) Transcript_102947:301-975(-)